MNRKLNLEKRRCNYKDWPIRRQLMISFMCTTVGLQIIIIIAIFLNVEIMRISTDSQIYDQVYNSSTYQLQQVAQQLGYSLQSHYFHLSYLLIGFQGMLDVIQYNLQIYSQNKNETYPLFCGKIQKISYDEVCFISNVDEDYFQQPTQVNNIFYKLISQQLLQLASNYKNLLPSFVSISMQQEIYRFILQIQQYDQNVQIMMIYPAQQINDTVSFKNISQKYQSFDYIYLIGPYEDELNVTQKNTLLSLNKITKSTFALDQIQYNLRFSLEFKTSSLEKFFSSNKTINNLKIIKLDLNFGSSTEVVVTDIVNNIIYAPKYWGINQNQGIQNIYNYPQYSGFKLKINLINNQGLNIESTPNYNATLVERLFNGDQQKQTAVLIVQQLMGTFQNQYLRSFINQNQNQTISYSAGTKIYLYSSKSELLYINNQLIQLIQNEENIIYLLTIVSFSLTISIVFIFTYLVSVKVSRPLRKLIITAGQLSAQATQKNIIKKIQDELNEIEATNQIADLITAFKSLVKMIETKINKQKSTAKKQILEYPLNQYDKQFIAINKGKSDINWHSELNDIRDDE